MGSVKDLRRNNKTSIEAAIWLMEDSAASIYEDVGIDRKEVLLVMKKIVSSTGAERRHRINKLEDMIDEYFR